MDNSTETLLALWATVLGQLHYIQGEYCADDAAMSAATASDLLAWCDDLEARLDYNVADMRAAMLDFIVMRDGGGNDPDLIAHRATLATPEHIAAYLAANPRASWTVAHYVYNDGTGHYHAEVINNMGRSQNMVSDTDCDKAVAQLNEIFRPLRKGE